ncbi:hypothetical protein C4564_03735 [Candidatus Microgenomates bacterium]|nr:MAG: hypothetical protein C4564_03735 [Candidatus Microgenomates bacterium]
MTKYKEYFLKMLSDNKELFDNFRKIHDKYALDMENMQATYNEAGKEIMSIIRAYEDKLCGHSESSGYANYSGNLAEKFQEEVRREFPQIDRVGIVVFNLKKITPAT